MKHEQQDLARELYFQTGKTQQEIANILDVNRRTVNLWIKQGRWDEMKAAARQMPLLIQQKIYNHFNAVDDQINKRPEDDRCPTMQEVEKMRKLLNMANSIKKQHTGAYIEAFQELYQFVYNRDSAFAKELSGHIQAYTRGTMGDKEFMTRKQRKDNVLEVTANLAKEEQKNYRMQNENCHPEPAEGSHPEPVEGEIFYDNNVPVETELELVEPSRFVPTPASVFSCRSFSEGSPLANNNAQQCDNNGIFCDKSTPVETHQILQNNTAQIECASPVNSDSECDNNGIFCDKNASCNPEPIERRKPFKIRNYVSGPCPIDDEKYPIPEDFDFKKLSFLLDDKEELTFDEVMQLPIAFRPSPFMDGDTVWVKEMDDVESPLTNFGLEWGVLKMGHTVRRYPDIDSAQAA